MRGSARWIGVAALACCMWAGAAPAATVLLASTDKNAAPLPDTVIYLESKSANRQTATAPMQAAVVQQNMQFAPYLSVVGVGAKVTFPNLDGVPHHIKSYSSAKEFEFKISEGTPPPVTFDKPGIVVLNCLIHDWMRGYIVVIDTPFYAVMDAGGHAKIDGVPPGDYTAYAWHPDLGNFLPPLTQDVTVIADNTIVRFDFPFAPRPKKKMHPM